MALNLQPDSITTTSVKMVTKMSYFLNFPNLSELNDFQKELKECFEKFRKTTTRRALDETSSKNEDVDAILEKNQCLKNLGTVLTDCFEKTLKLVDASISDWRNEPNKILTVNKQEICSPVLGGSSSYLSSVPQDEPFTTLFSSDKKQSSPGFYRQMEKDELKFLCFVGNNSSGLYFNHKIPIDQVELFVTFFVFCRDKDDSTREQLGFVDFMKFSLVCDSLLKFSKQHPNPNLEKMRLNWSEKSDKKTSDKSFKIFKKPEIIHLLPSLYIYQCRDVLNFLLGKKLVFSGKRGHYAASSILNEVGLRDALNELPLL